MPMIVFVCNNPDCDNHIKKLYGSVKEIPPFLDCGACGSGKLERSLSAPASTSTQVIDNGIQSKAVEINNEVVEKERQRLYTDD